MTEIRRSQTLFVTGGMSGLGKGLAATYLRRGADVAIFDLAVREEVMTELDQLKCRQDQQVVAYAVSVADLQALCTSVRKAVESIGEPQLAINCAGMQRAAPFAELSAADFELVVQINLFGSRNFAEAVLPFMKEGSRLALVSSMAGFAANYSYSAYNASKFAVIGLGRALRLELKPTGREVSLICPPEVDTPMVVEECRGMHPVSRTLKDLAGALTVDEAITGIVAGLDAGKHVIIPGRKAKFAYMCNRYLPDFLMNGIVDRIVRSVLSKMPHCMA